MKNTINIRFFFLLILIFTYEVSLTLYFLKFVELLPGILIDNLNIYFSKTKVIDPTAWNYCVVWRCFLDSTFAPISEILKRCNYNYIDKIFILFDIKEHNDKILLISQVYSKSFFSFLGLFFFKIYYFCIKIQFKIFENDKKVKIDELKERGIYNHYTALTIRVKHLSLQIFFILVYFFLLLSIWLYIYYKLKNFLYIQWIITSFERDPDFRLRYNYGNSYK